MLIKVLPPENFGMPLQIFKGFSSRVMSADVAIEPSQYSRCYIKAFPIGSRGLANEITHWILQQTLSLPQPDQVFILMISTCLLRKHWPDDDWGSEDVYPVFCSLAVQSDAPKLVFSGYRNKTLIDELIRWEHLIGVIAAHEWAANADCNASNFIRLGNGRFASLDGGHLFGGQDWTPESLNFLGFIVNKLVHLIWEGVPDAETINRIVKKAEHHKEALHLCVHELFFWWWELLDKRHAEAAQNFLERRSGPDWIRSRFA